MSNLPPDSRLAMAALALAGFLILYQAQAEIVRVGAGQYTTDLSAGQRGPSNQDLRPTVPYVTAQFAQIPITNKWWSSLIWKFNPNNPWSEGLFPYPFSFRASSKGLRMGYATRYEVSPYHTTRLGVRVHEYHYDHPEDLTVGIRGLIASETRVERYGDWTVTAAWSKGIRTLKATIGQGLPYAYFHARGDHVVITLSGPHQVWYQNQETLGLTINGHHYAIFAPKGADWNIQSRSELESDLNGKDYFSIATLPEGNENTLQFYRQHAYAFITDTQVRWKYDSDRARLITQFRATTELKENGLSDQPLLALFRHQWLNSGEVLTPYSYVSPRGAMKVLESSQFSTTLTFNGVLPELPLVATDGTDSFSRERLYQLIDTVYNQSVAERWNHLSPGDSYWFGKAVGKISRLVTIADQAGHLAARNLFLGELKTKLENWFRGRGGQSFYYDKTWKTLIGYPASFGSDTSLNDHNFHYGYFIQAAATIAQYDRSWASRDQFGEMVELLIKDVNNWDRTGLQFPFLRYMDPYEGHGWASGPSPFLAGNNEESSSEGINFATAVILWGAFTENQEIRDLGIYLYVTQVSAIEQYWFDINQEVFPAEFPEPNIGILWGDGAAYAIWWEGFVEELHGINFLPITGGSLYLGRNPKYLKKNQDFMRSRESGTNPDRWRDIHMSVEALYDPAAAILEFNQNPSYSIETGESRAHTYYWIHNLNRLGELNSRITANTPTYAAFLKNGRPHHVAYNSSNYERRVTFSDGLSLQVPPKSFRWASGKK